MQFNQDPLGSSLQSEINITPLVDVVLVLLIIFMVVVPLLIEGYNVDIPRSSADAVPAQSAELQLVLSIAPTACRILEPPAGEGLPADCQVTLANQKIPVDELPARVAEILGSQPEEKRVLFLAADDRLNYEGVLRIIDLAKSGVEDLQIEFIATN
jgi:biopolymer transport protein ExbD